MTKQMSHRAEMPQSETTTRSRGKLKIFLSYAPGTGKTLAMLEDAYHRSTEGTHVMAGFVGMQEDVLARQLLEKFEILPQRVLNGSGLTFQGMDLDAILDRRPQLVLIDHLAQANPPGVRHEVRYLEVEELLRAGVDVYTTLNVYQIESQVDAVNFLTGVTIRETVPDRLLDEADVIQLVDLPPQQLMEHYQAGKISFPHKVESLMEKFFQLANLLALRELSLRYMARRSNDMMRSHLADRGLADAPTVLQRLLVCIGSDPSHSRLVRAGRRMADETRAEWTVVYVETSNNQGVVEQEQAAQNLRLAELLGANTEVLTGRSVAETVCNYARNHHISKVVVGRAAPTGWIKPFSRTLSEQLLRMEPSLNVYVVGEDTLPRQYSMPRFFGKIGLLKLFSSLGLVFLPTLIGLLLTPLVISRSANLIMLYLVSVVIASVFLGLVPAILTAVLSVVAFKYWFIPPLYQFSGFAPEYTITFLSLLMISIFVSTLVSRERTLNRAAQRKADQITQLYELSRDLAVAVDMSNILKVIMQHFTQTFGRDTIVLLGESGELILSASSADRDLDSSELTAAGWAYQQGRPAGANTGTFSYASFSYFPMITSRGTVGVIGLGSGEQHENLHPEQMRQLSAFVTKAAMAIERGLFAEQASQAEVLRATEKLQTALLNSISHDLRTPLASITGVLSSLRLEDHLIDAETRRELVETAFGEAERLNRLVGNLLDMTRLEAGNLRLSLQPCDIQDIIGSALTTLSSRLDGHPVKVEVDPNLPLAHMDYVLIAQVMVNLLENAAKYSSEDGPIEIAARVQPDSGGKKWLEVEIADRGPGIPPEDLGRIFEKFYRVKRFENVVGTGLGLAICKGIVEVHDGKIWAENREGGGVRMIFSLPFRATVETFRERTVEAVNEEQRT